MAHKNKHHFRLEELPLLIEILKFLKKKPVPPPLKGFLVFVLWQAFGALTLSPQSL